MSATGGLAPSTRTHPRLDVTAPVALVGDYTQMAEVYDEIMLAGYYDYVGIADALARCEGSSVLELGVGTGLILQRLVARRPELELAGVDLTASMLDQAAERLHAYPHISLLLQDVVTLNLGRQFDVIFSYGGPAYFVREDAGTAMMISHIPGRPANQQAFERIAEHLPAGGTLLLGVQGPHTDYTEPIGAGRVYAQKIEATAEGFRKHYRLTDQGRTVMQQSTDYRTWSFADALQLLDQCGLEYLPETRDLGADVSLFMGFRRR